MKLPNKMYDILKWVAILALPAIGLFYGQIGPIWNLPYVSEIVDTLNAAGLLIGTLIGLSTLAHNKSNEGGE